MTQVVYIDNGWIYMFQFTGSSTHKLYSDFERLLKSVQYPSTSSEICMESGGKSPINANDNSGIIAVVFLLVVAIVVVIIVVSQKKKNTDTFDCAPTYTPPAPQPPRVPQTTIICKNCGLALPLDSVFCHVCGTKIEKES